MFKLNFMLRELTASMVPITPPANAQVPNTPKIELRTSSENHESRTLVQLGQH